MIRVPLGSMSPSANWELELSTPSQETDSHQITRLNCKLECLTLTSIDAHVTHTGFQAATALLRMPQPVCEAKPEYSNSTPCEVPVRNFPLQFLTDHDQCCAYHT